MDISVIVSTYNRGDLLGRAIASILDQEPGTPPFELIIVNNNSTDNTANVIDSLAARDNRVRNVFEKRQGVAYGRNAGIAAAQGQFIIFTDDDNLVGRNWIRKFHEAFLRYPEAAFIGGKVLPICEAEPEPWLEMMAAPPLALQDMGEKPVKVTLEHQRCLISACLGVPCRTFDTAGLFDPATQRVGNSIGSMEDYDWELSVWKTGGFGMYVPDIVCHSEVPAARMLKSYHRRWHLGHGKFNAISNRPEYQPGHLQLLGVPAFAYRQLLESALKAVVYYLCRRPKQAFLHESSMLFYFGLIRQRWHSALKSRRSDRTALPERT